VQAGELTLHCRQGGRGDRTVVFLNSLGSDLSIWDDVACAVAPHVRTVQYDLRGHGLSDAPPAPYTVRESPTAHREAETAKAHRG